MEVLLAGTGAAVVVVGRLDRLAAVLAGEAVVEAAVALEVVLVELLASLALFSALILSISSSSLAAPDGLEGVTAGLGAAGFGAGGGVSFFLGRANSISRSWRVNHCYQHDIFTDWRLSSLEKTKTYLTFSCFYLLKKTKNVTKLEI